MMDIHEILKKLPHRYPFLMVDRVLSMEKGRPFRHSKTSPSMSHFSMGIFHIVRSCQVC